MLTNRFAGTALQKMKKLKDAGIVMNGQIVLCKGWNDGDELEKTLHDLAAFIPELNSVSVVPVGLTRFREGLTQLEPFTKEDSLKVLSQIHRWQGIFLKHYGTRLVYASDEWYLKAGLPIPDEESYEGYPQIENGVGLVRSLQTEFEEALEELVPDERVRNLSLATGVLAAPVIESLIKKLNIKFPNVKVKVYTITNNYFGPLITVAGLLTGKDIIEQLQGKELYDALLLPGVLLRSGEDVLLDDVTVSDIERSLQTKVRIVQSDGKSLVDAILC